MSGSLERVAPAKINLALHVTGRRADGYHLLDSLVAFTRHGDRMRVEKADRDSFFVTGPFAKQLFPDDRGNLVLRARDLLRQKFGVAASRPVALTLEKNLPIASGIGGGSSDAAATLALLTRYWGLGVGPQDLERLALELGADVPMCLLARPLLARGIGEALDPVEALPPLPLLLINQGVPLETSSVFNALLKRDNPPLPDLRPGILREPGNLREIVDWLRSTRNDLEAPALSLMPAIGRLLALLTEKGALLARMSGSGATCFGIFDSMDEATRAAAEIAAEQPGWFVRATTTMASAPEFAHG